MTAEVCVMNKLGIAMAADSAVTRAGPSDTKIYQSADKLFALSHRDPVGVMIYGSATFMGIPWETIIKLYRQAHGHESRDRVMDHALGLMSFLARSGELFPEDLQREYMVGDLGAYFAHLKELFKEEIGKVIGRKGTVTEAQIKSSFFKGCHRRI